MFGNLLIFYKLVIQYSERYIQSQNFIQSFYSHKYFSWNQPLVSDQQHSFVAFCFIG